MTQTIQIPASMAGHQLMAVQMPDGRQQIFALQGNQTLQMFNTPAGLQQVRRLKLALAGRLHGWFRFNKLYSKQLETINNI